MSVLQQGSLDWICIVCVYIWFLDLDGLSIPRGSDVSFPFAGFGATLTQRAQMLRVNLLNTANMNDISLGTDLSGAGRSRQRNPTIPTPLQSISYSAHM